MDAHLYIAFLDSVKKIDTDIHKKRSAGGNYLLQDAGKMVQRQQMTIPKYIFENKTNKWKCTATDIHKGGYAASMDTYETTESHF